MNVKERRQTQLIHPDNTETHDPNLAADFARVLQEAGVDDKKLKKQLQGNSSRVHGDLDNLTAEVDSNIEGRTRLLQVRREVYNVKSPKNPLTGAKCGRSRGPGKSKNPTPPPGKPRPKPTT